MANSAVYRSFEVHEGFGPEAGPLRVECQRRAEADEALERMSIQGSSVQLYGIRSDGEPVLLRMLLGRRAA